MQAVNLRGKSYSIQDFTQILANKVEEVLTATDCNKVDLVGHSMGGLVIRSYLAEESAKTRVRRVVTLGSPHAGSKLAVFGVRTAMKEMLPGSAFLETLNRAGNQVPPDGTLYAIYSILDNMVLPNDSAMLGGDGVENVETRLINHVGLVFCRHTAGLVRQCLNEP